MSNTFKVKAKSESRKSLFALFDKVLNVDSIFESGLPVRFLPHVLFMTGLAIIYIGNSHYSDKLIRRIDRVQLEVEDLRADYTTLKADYMFASKQSEVAKKVAPMGLQESSEPPIKIIVKK